MTVLRAQYMLHLMKTTRSNILPTRTATISTIGLPPCCPCGEDHGLNAEGRCPACERANRILQARLECPVGMCTPAARCSACTDS